ncbi:hypothetical protein [Candidatus Viridilinea mediisalina]|uniref:N-acetyltransferase domain-containing protein n=1 Tax=Candidatus Viridilinea mediisalina TaxID=2024553 RepID=A0A2A6RJB0_9CHLR|nr:hypothetical protein [Candidatus Viridilinea mediisalina]PDW02948.1 hypothetical protein CJ255_11255 [Candidatus Viridilinea mediisalina]
MATCSPDHIWNIAHTMTDSFLEDPLFENIFQGIQNKAQLLHITSLLQIKQAANSERMQLHLLDGNPRAFLIGGYSKHQSYWKQALLMLKTYMVVFSTLSWADIRTLWANNQSIRDVLNLGWYQEFVGENYYHLKIIAIDKHLRGTGAFRKLITPVLINCDLQQIPIVLETHNEQNVAIYAHFDFELVHTISAPHTNLKQYCMVRYPQV